MTENEITTLVAKQREFFKSGKTLSVDYRIAALKRLKNEILKYEQDIMSAIKADLGKSVHESYMCEVGLALSELTYMLKHTKRFAKSKTVHTPLAQFHSKSYKKPSPYGVVLIMSPWNYPFLLTIDPLIDAIAAGNTVILKPSAYSPNTSAIITSLINKCFDEKYVAVVTGGRAENTALLKSHFDYIFFTGSQAVGKTVLENAAAYLTPVTLELGGKSPCIVADDANLKLAARRIVFGKYLNCGQTCVAPDYVYCDAKIKDKLLTEIKKEIIRQYSENALSNPDYGKIINLKHFNRINSLIDKDKVIYGGNSDSGSLKIEPTVMDNVTFTDDVMLEEIFGPVMPVLTFTNIDEAITKINSMPHPLALYIFTSSHKTADKVLSHTGFGGGCVNDTIIHLATTEMGFGGFGESGMGSYHGKTGFDTFSHYKSIVDKKTWIDLPMRYQPYTSFNEKLIRFFLK